MLGDTLDYHLNDPMKWVVETILCAYLEGGMSKREVLAITPETHVEGCLDFVNAAFEEEGLDPPNAELVLRAVRKRLREIAEEDEEDVDEEDDEDEDTEP